jgi:hypothetical protein
MLDQAGFDINITLTDRALPMPSPHVTTPGAGSSMLICGMAPIRARCHIDRGRNARRRPWRT